MARSAVIQFSFDIEHACLLPLMKHDIRAGSEETTVTKTKHHHFCHFLPLKRQRIPTPPAKLLGKLDRRLEIVLVRIAPRLRGIVHRAQPLIRSAKTHPKTRHS